MAMISSMGYSQSPKILFKKKKKKKKKKEKKTRSQDLDFEMFCSQHLNQGQVQH
jgi:hypothetical protein